jgi:uncharacterized protein (TIGR00369 family)
MNKIKNPFTIHSQKDYNCFGCCPNNEFGLHLDFWETEEGVKTEWEPKSWLVGYGNVVHGGIQATLMDEVAGWVVLIKCRTAGVTTEMDIRYLKPATIAKGKIEVKGELIKYENNIAEINCRLNDGEGVCCATAGIKYFCYPEPVAKRKLGYPGVEAFYE